jgi:hypothetical protein
MSEELKERLEALEARVVELERALNVATIDRTTHGRLTFIRDVVALYYDVPPAVLQLGKRNKHPHFTRARHVFWLMAYEAGGITQTAIGAYCGGLTQDAVSYAIIRLRAAIAGRTTKKSGRPWHTNEASRIALLRDQVIAELARFDSGEVPSLKEKQWSDLRRGMELKQGDREAA